MSAPADVRIASLTGDDAPAVAGIHARELPADFCSLLGIGFLRDAYYRDLFAEPRSFALGAYDGDGLIGFIAFTNDPSFARSVVERHLRTAALGALRRLARPNFIRYAGEATALVLVRRAREEELDGYELAYIAVAARYQGRGIGAALVERGLTRLAHLGTARCWVKTLSRDPETLRFYERLGFAPYATFLGRTYLARSVALH